MKKNNIKEPPQFTEQEIADGNALIELFAPDVTKELVEHEEYHWPEQLEFKKVLRFHSNADWLIPAIEKAEKLEVGEGNKVGLYCDTYEGSNFYIQMFNGTKHSLLNRYYGENKVLDMWSALVVFLEWFPTFCKMNGIKCPYIKTGATIYKSPIYNGPYFDEVNGDWTDHYEKAEE